jgi:molybdenum cofactor guanylyltransferase
MRRPRSRCGVLLAGGASARFGGRPKGLMPFGAARLTDAAYHALQATCDRVVIAANDPAAADWFPGDEIVRDREPGRGALSALETALVAARADIVLVCAWDMPFVTAELLDALASAVDGSVMACVPQHADGRWEPLCAAYDETCAVSATALLAAGERAAHRLVEHCAGVAYPLTADAAHLVLNVNTSSDLARADALRLTLSAVRS